MSIIEAALKKDGSDFQALPAGTANIELIYGGCPKCQSDVLCAYAELGTTDFCDCYHHVCANLECDFIKKKDEFGIGMGTREYDGPSHCPFCGRNVS